MAWNLTGTSSDARVQRAACEPAERAFGQYGEPIPARTPALSVSEALARAKGALETMTLVVEGEVSQYSDKPTYKAVYFPVADGAGVMDCMMWRNRYNACGVQLKPGLKVRLTGRFTVFPAKGRMQFEVFRIELAGEGDLRERVARLARKLDAEGLMDPARKPRVPAFCQRVVVITSAHGKVKDDVARTLRRRNPLVELQYCAVIVEGAAAPHQMIEALRVAESARPDAILLVRGGGSYEDLMPFNDEGLARAVAACRVPVVTGIGHEPDTTICDMVAARRASTPTAAAESVAPSRDELLSLLDARALRMAKTLERSVSQRRAGLEALAVRPVLRDPARALVEPRAQRLDYAHDRLMASLPGMVEARASSLNGSAARLRAQGARLVTGEREALQGLARHMRAVCRTMLSVPQSQTAVAAGRLEALSPLAVIARGYAMALDNEGHVVKHIGDVRDGSDIAVRVSDGFLDCEVRSTRPLEHHASYCALPG